ncbi:MAG TPA: ATP-binding cassette domain-containing protein [Deltaproteobacteria bacterium]|nr:ATP-binding cassette domain-containing protein [Deltaproteobacteria bacterium]
MIHLEQLTKYYGQLCAVDHIDLDIDKGEITGLLGPNGAGKTTTLRMLTGYLLPSSGTIKVHGYSIEEAALQIKRLIGYLPESAPLYYNMLVYDYLDYVATVRGIERSRRMNRIRTMVGLCGLNGIMHKSIGELSKGLKQRVGLAHAMIDDPEILVLDEPTSGLDPNQIMEIRDIIRGIGKEKTIIVSTHILSEAEATCDRIVIIDKGSIVADGSTEMLRLSMGQEKKITLSLLNADIDRVRERLLDVEGISGVEQLGEPQDGELRIRLTTQGDIDTREKIYRSIRETDWIILEFSQETKSLEMIFRELTREV